MNKLTGTGRTTKEESIQDIPTGMEESITITFNSGEKTTVFVYKKADKYYIEQPYNGIYEITQEEYNDIMQSKEGIKI